jgi:hypothetical protein
MMSGRRRGLLAVWPGLLVGRLIRRTLIRLLTRIWLLPVKLRRIRRMPRRGTVLRIRRERRLARLLTIRLLRIPEPGFLPPSGQRLRMQAPLPAIPPARCRKSSRIQVPAWRRSCGYFSLVFGWLLVAHSFLPPERGQAGRALPLQETRQRPLWCAGTANLTYSCDQVVSCGN